MNFQLYQNFVKQFASKINQLKLVIIASNAVKQYYPSREYVHEGRFMTA